MMILAIDASTKSTGYALLDNKLKLTDYGCITASSTDLFKRIHMMLSALELVLKKFNIEKIIMEEVRPEQGLQNIKTHKALLYLQGAIAMMVHDNFPKIHIEYIYPNEWRKYCGIKTGSGIKRESLKAKDIAFVKETYNISVNDDEADAIGIGYGYLIKNGTSDNKIEWND